MIESLANLAAVAATLLTAAFLLPQVIKLIRTGDSEGVSATWPALGFVTNVGWFVYIINQGLWTAIFAPFITFIFYAVTLWAVGRTGRSLRAAMLRGAGWSVLLVTVLATGGWITFGVVLGLSYSVVLAPSVWTAYRTVEPSGIAPGSWWIGGLEAALWGYYGAYHSDRGILTLAVIGVVGSTLMLARYYGTRRRVGDGVTVPTPKPASRR